MISNATLKGHGAAVLCLDVSSPSSSSPSSLSSSRLLLSGSEDGTARIWDLREHKRRTCLCIKVPGGGDVLSCVFAPPPPPVAHAATIISSEESVDTTAFGRDYTVYLGVENTVLEYDLRKADAPIIISEPSQDWGPILKNQDEVNQISLAYNNNNNNNNTTIPKKKKNQKKKGGGGNKKRQQSCGGGGGENIEFGPESLYLAACDDAGKVACCNYRNHGGNGTILHHDDDGVAVVTACAFRPVVHNTNHKRGGGSGTALEIASGGTDCKIHLWDIFRKKPISTYTIKPSNTTDEEEKSKPQVCNPPFVYSLAWSNDGKALAGGLGDGTVGVFEVNNRALVQSKLLIGNEGIDGTMYYAHESSVASVVYPCFSAPTNDRILCSAGSDGSIVFWDLGKSSDEHWDDFETTETKNSNTEIDSNDVVATMFPPRLLQGLRNDNDAGIYHNKSAMIHKPKILFDIPHGEKINWVTPATPSSNTPSECNDTIFVADTSPDITSYTIPFS